MEGLQPSVRKGQGSGQKVKSSQRARPFRSEDDPRKRQATQDELEKMKSLHTFMEALNRTVDPFTTEEIEIALSQVSGLTGGQLSEKDCQDLFHDYIIDPNKNKSERYAEITESKKRYDLVWNKDDSEENGLASKRFELYNQCIPVSQSTRDILAFLKEVSSRPPSTSAERRRVLLHARELASSEPDSEVQLSADSLERLIEAVREVELLSTQPPPETRSLTEGVSAR